ncbi:MAG TPA: trypsin-like peptidase domain-containing protein [Gaiellaceae bacterium]|jgi:S1-C subfamily serine protease|nr:trypsin-like peptidase domain-containing protein [Gaiellaceae bacterium]
MPSAVTRAGALLLAALLGGGVAVGIGAAVDPETRTVVTTLEQASAVAPPSFAGRDEALSIQDIYETAGPGVVQVTSTSVVSRDPFFGAQEARSVGSGFVIDKAGRIVTNYHVVEGADEVEVNFSGDDRVPARIVGTDPSTDIAVLEIDAQARALTPLRLANSDAVRVGDAVVAIGNPFGLERSVTAGIVSALQRDIRAPDGFTIDKAIQTDAPINQGNSGGPLLNSRGQVIGVNSQIQTETGGNVGIGFAVPINTVKQVVSDILETGRVDHAWLGIQMQGIGESLSETFRLPVSEGLLVAAVTPDSPAERAGLRGGDRTVVVDGVSYVLGGDIITRVDGDKVTVPEDLSGLVMAKEPGDVLALEIQRGDFQRTVNVTLGRRPSEPAG